MTTIIKIEYYQVMDKQQKNIHLIIWMALLASNCVFAYLVFSDSLQTSSMQKGEGIITQIPFLMAAILAALSFFIFRWGTNLQKLKSRLNSVPDTLPSNAPVTPQHYEAFNKMSSLERKKYNLKNQAFIYAILSWALAESVNIFGMIAPMLGATNDYYYYFFGAAISLMFLNHPKHIQNIDNLK